MKENKIGEKNVNVRRKLVIGAYIRRNMVYVLLGKYELAKNDVLKACEISEITKDEISIADSYISLSSLQTGLGDYEAMKKYAEKVIEICRRINYTKGLFHGLHNVGYYYMMKGMHEDALKLFNRSLKLNYDKEVENGKSVILGNMAYIYNAQGQYKKAIHYYNRSLKHSRKEGLLKETGHRLNNIGSLYFQKGQYNKAISYYKESLEIRKKIQEKDGEAVCLNNIGSIYLTANNLIESDRYFLRSLKMKEEIKDIRGQMNSFNSLSTVYRLKGKFKKCRYCLKKAYEIGSKLGEKLNFIVTHIFTGLLEQCEGNIKKSDEWFIKSNEMSLSNKYLLGLYLGNYGLAKNSLIKNDMDNAEIYLLKAEEYAKKIKSFLNIQKCMTLKIEILMIKNKNRLDKQKIEGILIPDKLMMLFEQAKKQKAMDLVGEINLLLARYYDACDDTEKAQEYFKNSMQKYKSIGYVYDEIRVCGHFLRHLKKHNKFSDISIIMKRIRSLWTKTDIKEKMW